VTVFEGREGVALYQLIALKHAMKLSMMGIQPGRGWTRKAMLALATKYTEKEYKRGIRGFEQAYEDVCAVVEYCKEQRSSAM
jgi:hypothetical protein